MGQGADVKKRDRKSFKRLDRAIAELAAVQMGSTVSFAAYEPFKASEPGRTVGNVRIGWEDGFATIVWTCVACGEVRKLACCCKVSANVTNERLWSAVVEQHKDCKVPT